MRHRNVLAKDKKGDAKQRHKKLNPSRGGGEKGGKKKSGLKHTRQKTKEAGIVNQGGEGEERDVPLIFRSKESLSDRKGSCKEEKKTGKARDQDFL